jgi:hypothetical protein
MKHLKVADIPAFVSGARTITQMKKAGSYSVVPVGQQLAQSLRNLEHQIFSSKPSRPTVPRSRPP